MTNTSTQSWTEQNHATLLREFAAMRVRLGEDPVEYFGKSDEEEIGERPAAIDALAAAFGCCCYVQVWRWSRRWQSAVQS
jgi:hypothetical protein